MSPGATPTPKVRFMELPSTRIRYLQAGTGSATIVFAADPPNVVEHYTDLVAELSPHMRVVVFEPPGFGMSKPRRRMGFDRAQQADLVASFLEGLGHGACILAFPCLAAYTAIEVAARHPALVERLILLQAPGLDDERAWVRRVSLRGAMTAPLIGAAISRFAKATVARKWYDAAVPDRTKAWRLRAVAQGAFKAGARFPLSSALRAFVRDASTLPVARQPALVVWGVDDPTHKRSDRRSLQTHLRSVAFLEFDGCGHFPELEAPDRFAAAVLSWLGHRASLAALNERVS